MAFVEHPGDDGSLMLWREEEVQVPAGAASAAGDEDASRKRARHARPASVVGDPDVKTECVVLVETLKTRIVSSLDAILVKMRSGVSDEILQDIYGARCDVEQVELVARAFERLIAFADGGETTEIYGRARDLAVRAGIDTDSEDIRSLPPAAKTVHNVWTDGACPDNQNQARCVCGVGVFFGEKDTRNKSFCITKNALPSGNTGQIVTNNVAELVAIYEAMNSVLPTDDLNIMSDSMYAINAVSKWYDSWIHAGTMGDKKNVPLIAAANALMKRRTILGAKTVFKFVKGHAGEPGNIQADNLATTACNFRRHHPIYSPDLPHT